MTEQEGSSLRAEIVAAVSRFIEREVIGQAKRMDLGQAEADALLVKMRDLGLFGMAIPEKFNGLDLNFETIAEIMEIVARGWTTLAAYLNSHTTVCHIISRHATETQQARYLPALARGEPRAALCLTEPDAGSDLKAIRTIAQSSEGAYRINGDKVFVTNGARAGLLLVLAKTEPTSEAAKHNIGLFLIDKSTTGVAVGDHFEKMAFDCVDTCPIALQDVHAPADTLLGGVAGRGLAQLLDGLELGRIEIAASAVGLAQAAMDQALLYAKERRTFGKPIAEHQAIQLELAAMATKIMAARSLTREAARQKTRMGRADMICSMAKLFASETGLEAAASAVRIHGGYGYIKGYPVERLFREAPLYIVGEGTNEIQKLVIARRLLETAS